MAKKKKQRTEETSKFQYTNEVFGLILILLSITGIGAFGLVGGIIKKFSIFMFGSWYIIFLIFMLGIGIYLIAKRGKPNYFTARLIGIYSLIIALLLFSHIKYISANELNTSDIFSTTISNIEASFDADEQIRNTGGGIVGAFFSWAFVSLFAVEGTKIVIVIISIFGLIMLFDLSLSDILGAIGRFFKKLFYKEEVETEETESEEESETVEDKRVVITSVEDLEPHKPETIGTIVSDEQSRSDNSDSDKDVYMKPPVALLEPNKFKNNKLNTTEYIANNTSTLERVFEDFGMHAKVIEVHVGPAVTQYEMAIDRGTKVNKVLSISREIALALAAKEVRIEAPIPGKNTVGVEIPNQKIIPVSMREIMEAIPKKFDDSKLLAPLGRDIMGNVKYVEVDRTPHMLVAGATGSGKSVCINNIIISLLMRTTPEEVKMVLVDPKKVEFSVYEGIPHLLTPVVTDPKKANVALQKIVIEMDERYETFKNTGNKNITSYNEYIDKKLKKEPNCGLKRMPYIVVIIDELADLMLVAAKEVEESIMRITQLARAAGIHLIVATQRPSANIITGVIKANIPTRVSFAVSSSIDSRTILDMTGAEKLLGKGDMLYKPMDQNTPTRIQGSFVSDEEIKRVVDFVKEGSHGPKYSDKFETLENTNTGGMESGFNIDKSEQKDVLYDEILNYAIRMGQISASLIQRKYSIGYNRAARIMDLFEERGIVGPAKGSKPRDVLVKLEDNKEE